ncbi:MAG: lytic murein transglycosylase [Alphaproteobacteria bacterium]|nr:lytic murein transglycosylase [Alphaproteobacteria bacterium]NCQ88008.1 lytic murein transglycosylase [Alphaproteobacteria bacterium]NCT05485.1 lytic murein transglycosylase [Alphaproteobacteria bacterium]
MRNYFKKIVLTFVFALSFYSTSLKAETFESWLAQTKIEARAHGISHATIDAAFSDVALIQRVVELDKKQPETKKTFVQYREAIVNQNRITKGRALIQQHADALNEIEAKYGVPKQFIVALWGIETNFGSNTGGFKVIPALATLAYDGRRREFFTRELMNALQIIDDGHISAANMKGSWAGAMGQNQFMPSSFNAFAVDHNGDGKRDIWGTYIDIFASSANYLKKNGWKTGEIWGRRAQLPANFPENMIGPKIQKPISYWANLGVKKYGGGALPNEDMMASIVAPDGLGGEVYIVYNNYQTIMDWNRSTYFATSVGLLADQLAR